MRALILILLFIVGVHTPQKSYADTSKDEAVACFNQMLAEVRGGASFSYLVESYVAVSTVASRAVAFQKKLVWSKLSAAEKKLYTDAILTYFATEKKKVAKGIGKQDFVQLETVELRPRQHKRVDGGYQLSGEYITVGGTKTNFALFISKHKGRCYIQDARWLDAWLSKWVPLP